MIGTNKEMLFFATLINGWYKPIGMNYREAYKFKIRLRKNLVSNAYCDSILSRLGFIKIRDSYNVSAIYKKDNTLIDEYNLISMITSKAGWYKGLINKDTAKDIRKSLKTNTLIEGNANLIAVNFGYELVCKRIFIPSVWEKPSVVSDKAFTKLEALDKLLHDYSEI